MGLLHKKPRLSLIEKFVVWKDGFHNQKFAFFISGIVLWSFLLGFTFYSYNKPLIATGYYHANIQFRAGTEQSYDDIFNQSLQYIVDMYYRHPNWVWTLECQGLLIEMAYERYPEIFYKIQEMNQRGQLEIISPQYSHALVVAYNYKDFAESISYNKYLLEEVYNLTVSNVIVLQEGQWLPAFPLIKHLGFDVMCVSRDQLAYHNYFPKEPLLHYTFAGIPAYVMPVTWLPLFEADAFHFQLVLSDSERVNTGGEGAIEGDYEFNFNPEKQKELELRHIELEKRGTIFMTLSQWAKRNIEKGFVGEMDRFMPESHWTPQRHCSVSRWMAWGNGESDDGLVHARNYYTRNLIQAAEVLLEHAKNNALPLNYSYYESLLLEAKKHLWLSQVTDTSGVNPNANEFLYAINNTYIAQQYSQEIIKAVKAAFGYSGALQVNVYNRRIITDSSKFTYYSLISPNISENELSSRFPFRLEIQYNHQNIMPFNVTRELGVLHYFINGSFHNFTVVKLIFEFAGPRDMYIENSGLYNGSFNDYALFNGDRSEQHILFHDQWQDCVYSPSLAENLTQKIHRDDYKNPAMTEPDYYLVPLPISNGLLYNPSENYAIITNNTVRHISVRWEDSFVDFYETLVKFNARYEFFLFSGSLEDAHLLANLINPYPILDISKEVA